jgi:hypothetical protein
MGSTLRMGRAGTAGASPCARPPAADRPATRMSRSARPAQRRTGKYSRGVTPMVRWKALTKELAEA